MQLRRYVGSALVVAALIGGLPGCGGGGDTLNLGGGGSKQLTASDLPRRQFVPAVIRAPVQKEVTFTVKNEGDVTHNFSVSSIGIDRDVEPGKSVEVTLPPLEGTTLTFYDKRYQADGMQGKLSVRG